VKYQPLYIAATGQHMGKTTAALGLFRAMQDRGLRAGFMKPVGQSYVVVDGDKVDEDVALIRDTFHTDGALTDMSPIIVERGFTEEHIFARDRLRLRRQVQDSYARLTDEKDVMIIEGTGHAGVGACFGLSNADVAEALSCKALIVSGGGIGRPIDEIALSAALFASRGVPTIGAVLNKVLPAKFDKVKRVVTAGLGNMGMRLVGCAPFEEDLTYPTVGQIKGHVKLELLAGEDHLQNRVEQRIVAAMKPEHMRQYLHDRTLVITPGDRTDNLAVCIEEQMGDGPPRLAGFVLTGGLVPPGRIMERLRQARLPVLLSNEDTATAARRINEIVFKIEPSDVDKIAAAQEMVARYVDTNLILSHL